MGPTPKEDTEDRYTVMYEIEGSTYRGPYWDARHASILGVYSAHQSSEKEKPCDAAPGFAHSN
jgi:hypothetical protein